MLCIIWSLYPLPTVYNANLRGARYTLTPWKRWCITNDNSIHSLVVRVPDRKHVSGVGVFFSMAQGNSDLCQAYISIFNYDLAPPIYLQKFGTAQLKRVMTDAKVSYQGVSRISILTSKFLVDKATE